jgi:elongation factor P
MHQAAQGSGINAEHRGGGHGLSPFGRWGAAESLPQGSPFRKPASAARRTTKLAAPRTGPYTRAHMPARPGRPRFNREDAGIPMAKMQANQMRAGMVIEFEGQRYTILKQNIMIPGKGAAVIQVEMRNVKTGAKKDQRWRTADTVERLTTEDKEFTYSYEDGTNLVLMDPETFEQTLVPKDILGDRLPFLQENMTVNVKLIEGEPVSMDLPETVTLEIVEADPVVKGQTASSSYKPAVLSNGVKVMVPPFITAGEKIVVKTADGTYYERAK